MFIAIALFGLFYGAGSFFWNFIQVKFFADGHAAFDLVSAGTIPLSNIAIGLKVAASLFLVIFALSTFRPAENNDKE